MAQHIRSSDLEFRSNRLKLEPQGKPRWVRLAPKIFAGYRRNESGPGTFSGKFGNGPGQWIKRIALADDFEEANGTTVMNWRQLQEAVLKLARAGDGNDGAPQSVFGAIDDYDVDLAALGQSTYNAAYVRNYLSEALGNKAVALTAKRDFTAWRNALIKKGLALSTVDRYANAFKAALNLAMQNDDRITNSKAWKLGLKAISTDDDDDEGSTVSSNQILPDATCAQLVRESYVEGHDVGLMIDVLNETGNRESQCERLKVTSLQYENDDESKPRLMMPSSRKGRTRTKNRKARPPKPVSITPRLAALLREQAKGKAPSDPLLTPVAKLSARFAPVVKRCGLGPEVTPYALRHSSICRQLMKCFPPSVVALNHDTSLQMIMKNYSPLLTNHTDELTRTALLDLDATAEIIPFPVAS